MRHSDQITATLTINLDDGFFEADALWDVDGETYAAEPYSHGGSRGFEVSCGVELVSVKIGGFTATRSQIAEMIGDDDLRQQEQDIAEAQASDMLESA